MISARASLPALINALHAKEPPRHIWQEPFDGDPAYFSRLCNLKGSTPRESDLIDYQHDLCYASPLQPDLFRYLLPICLEIWRKDLLTNSQSGYGGFIEHFWAALANRPLLQENLTTSEYAAVVIFMTNALLDRIDQENSLSFSGMGAAPYTWFSALSSYCVVFPTLAPLWKYWWEMTNLGQACAVLQYLSCLLYEKDRNPIFSPWTPKEGGGPPSLWAPEGHIFDLGWRTDNIAFLQATLTVDYIESSLRLAAQKVKEVVESAVPQQMLNDFDAQKPLLALRLEELPRLLSTASEVQDWTI